MTISLKIESNFFSPRIEYVLNFLNNHPLIKGRCSFNLQDSNPDKCISYGTKFSEQLLFIPAQCMFFSNEYISTEGLVTNEYDHNGQKLFSVEKAKNKTREFLQGMNYAFDWIESIFFHISRYEEYFCEENKKDRWDMMWEHHQFLVRENLYKRPVVDQLVLAVLQSLGISVEHRKTTYSMTHDIDVLRKFSSPYLFFRSLGRVWLDHRSLKKTVNFIRLYFDVIRGKKKDPYDTFEDLFLQIEKTDNLERKIAFFMSGGETFRDNHYSINGPAADEALDIAIRRGYEIGLHSSYNTDRKVRLFRTEKEKLETAIHSKVRISRQHFLHFSFQSTPQVLENSDIFLDSTLGYQRLMGFRCGTGFPYQPYIFSEERPSRYQELPMVLMDGGLLEESKHDLDLALDELITFLQSNTMNTHITLNFHNTIFDSSKRDVNKMKELYSEVIKIISQ